MSAYARRVRGSIGHIHETTSRNFRTLRKLDQSAAQLEEALDETIHSLPLQGKPPKKAAEKIRLLQTAVEEATEKKISMTSSVYDVIDSSIRFVDEELKILEKVMKAKGIDYSGAVVVEQMATGGRKRKNAAIRGDAQVLVDPNEPRYCHCQQVAFGDMIACDNPECKIEWFHYGCVGLTKRPQNTWFCPTCSEKTKKSRHNSRSHK